MQEMTKLYSLRDTAHADKKTPAYRTSINVLSLITVRNPVAPNNRYVTITAFS